MYEYIYSCILISVIKFTRGKIAESLACFESEFNYRMLIANTVSTREAKYNVPNALYDMFRFAFSLGNFLFALERRDRRLFASPFEPRRATGRVAVPTQSSRRYVLQAEPLADAFRRKKWPHRKIFAELSFALLLRASNCTAGVIIANAKISNKNEIDDVKIMVLRGKSDKS